MPKASGATASESIEFDGYQGRFEDFYSRELQATLEVIERNVAATRARAATT